MNEIEVDLDYFDYDKIAYHGHTQSVIDKVIERGYFNFSDDDWEWLGTGAYFFEEDIQQAKSWCIRKNNYTNWSIIKAEIKTNRMINLVDTNHFNKFKNFVSLIRERYKKTGGLKKVTNKLIFDILYRLEEYDAVRHVFRVGEDADKIFPTQVNRMQVQVCVRNHECIENFEEVDSDEY